MLAVYMEWWAANHPWSDFIAMAMGWGVGWKLVDLGLWIMDRSTD